MPSKPTYNFASYLIQIMLIGSNIYLNEGE